MLTKLRVRRTTLLSVGLAAFLLGLVVAKWQTVWLSWQWLVFGLPLIFTLRKKTIASLISAVIIGGLIGVWRGGEVYCQVLRYNDFVGREVTVSGKVQNDPVYDDRGQLDFQITGVTVDGLALPGQVRVRGLINDLRRADMVTAEGRLQPGFGNYQAALSFADITVESRSGSWLEKTRRDFFASIYSILPDPEASLGLGFLVGLRSALPEDFDEQLRVVGLTHIVVASGYNLTILVRLSRRLLAKRSKYQAFASSVALVLAFIAITGASASIVRAAVVTLLSLAAWYYGRRIHPALIILLGASLTAGISPVYIWHDLGWWLSFLAFTGVLVLAPLLTAVVTRNRISQLPVLLQVAIETVSAQLMALPLIMHIFGDFSVVSLLANVAAVPFIPFAMLFTFIAGTVGLLAPAVAAWLALPANLLLTYIVQLTQLLASPSWVSLEITLSQTGMAIIYGCVIIVAAGLYRRSGFRFSQASAVIE